MSKEKAKLAALLIEHGYTKEARIILEGHSDISIKIADNSKLIYKINNQDGMEARCFLLNNGKISVVLYDLDSGESLPTIKIFKENDIKKAISYADSIV